MALLTISKLTKIFKYQRSAFKYFFKIQNYGMRLIKLKILNNFYKQSIQFSVLQFFDIFNGLKEGADC